MKTLSIIIFLLVSSATSFSQKRECDFLITSRNKNVSALIDSLQTIQPKTLNKKKFIPRFIKRTLNCWTDKFDIANPGKKYQASDVVSWRIKPLPWRQLNYLGLSNHYIIMTYKKGGFAATQHILIFRFDNKRITNFWSSNNVCPSSYNEILYLLKNHSDFFQSDDSNL